MDATTITAANQFAWWENAIEGNFGAVQDGKPEAGFYRYKNGKDKWIAVRIQLVDGEMIGVRAKDELITAANLSRVWQWCCKNPVSYDTYIKWIDMGEWPDHATLGATIGHNSGFGEGDLTDIKTEIDELKAISDAFLNQIGHAITQKAQADRAGNLTSEFGRLEEKADKARTKAKKPFLDGGRKVDKDWRPVIDAAMTEKVELKTILTTWLIAERKRLAEVEAKAREASDGTAVIISAPKAGGANGKSIGLRDTKVLKYTNYQDACQFCANQPKFWAHPDVLHIVSKLVKASLDAGMEVPGAELELVPQAV